MRRKLERTSAFEGAGRYRAAVIAAALGWVATTGCLPYPVGTTAQPVETGRTRSSTSVYFIPNAVSLRDELDSTRKTPPAPLRGTDFEFRRGIDSVSDVALHITSLSGFVLDYKRKFDGASDTTASATALLLGAGIVNFGDHAYGELGVIHSGRAVDGRVVYGGARVMQVVPIAPEAVSDRPTIGGFLGIRLPFGDFDASPELGVYYDHSALGVRRGDLLIVPSITIGAIRRPRRNRDATGPTVPVGGASVLPTVRWPMTRRGSPGQPEKPAAGPVATPRGARPIPPPSTPRTTAGASRRRGSRPARP